MRVCMEFRKQFQKVESKYRTLNISPVFNPILYLLFYYYYLLLFYYYHYFFVTISIICFSKKL